MKKIIFSPLAPAPIGPYSQAVAAQGFVYVSGQIALNAQTGTMQQNDIRTETHQVMKNLQVILVAADTELKNVVKTTIYLMDMSDFAAVNEVYATYFFDAPPARETVQVSQLPLGANVEISVVALQNNP